MIVTLNGERISVELDGQRASEFDASKIRSSLSNPRSRNDAGRWLWRRSAIRLLQSGFTLFEFLLKFLLLFSKAVYQFQLRGKCPILFFDIIRMRLSLVQCKGQLIAKLCGQRRSCVFDDEFIQLLKAR